MTKKNIITTLMLIGFICLVTWTIINTMDSIAYGIENEDALGGMLRLGKPMLPFLCYLVFVHWYIKRFIKK